MAEPGPEPGRAWRLLALCGAAVFLAAAAAGGALVAWNLAASTARGPRCPEPEQVNATLWPPDSAPEVEELRRRLAEAEQLHESLAAQLQRAKGDKRELEVAFKACKDRQVGAGEIQNIPQRDPAYPSLGPQCPPSLQRMDRKCRATAVSLVLPVLWSLTSDTTIPSDPRPCY